MAQERRRGRVFPLGTPCLRLLVGALLLLPAGLEGQVPDEPCTYDRCALRLRPGGWFSSATVVTGQDRVEVARYGRSSTLEELFARSDSAAAHYAAFAARHRRATRLQGAALGLVVASLGTELATEGRSGWALGLNAGGVTLGLISTGQHRRASGALGDAIWWYNRSLVEPEG